MLNKPGSGYNLLNHHQADVEFKGTLHFVERQTTPKIVGVVDPGWDPPAIMADAVKTPIPFHVFFSPPPLWSDAYPYGAKYLDFVYRYLLQNYQDGGHGMLYQNNADSPKVAFLFPMSHQGDWVGDVATQAGLYRLLQEVAYFLQRKQGATWPLQPVGSLSLSCYSAGATLLGKVLGGGKSMVSGFLTETLKNVFVFDGVPAGGEEGKKAFSKSLATWFQNPVGRQDRNLRSYTQHSTGFYELKNDLKLPVSAEAPAGAREVETDTCSLVLIPMALWTKMAPGWFSGERAYWRVHFSFPALLMEHAVTNSTF